MTNEAKQAGQEPQTPRIYVACLTSYTHGCLHGRWIDADQELEDILAEIQEMLTSSPFQLCEEYAIHDYDGFGSVKLDEYENLADVAALGQLISEWGAELASAAWDHAGADKQEARCILEENYQGSFEDLESWAEQLLQDIGELDQVPEHLRCYLDLAAYARDCELSGDVFTVEMPSGQVHVFWGR